VTVFYRSLLGGLGRFLLLGIVLCAGCSNNDADQIRRPNILLILADDLGVNDIGSWGDGVAATPTLDELSRESVRFRQHYTDSTCSPSRAALLTGRESVSIGFQADGLGLSEDLQTLPESLRSLGYRTVHIGKWHVGEALEYPEIRPTRHGFDEWFGMLNHFVLQGPGADGRLVRRQPTHINPWLQENDLAPRQYPGSLDDILTDRAIKEIAAAKDKPWFINLWLLSPHTPYQPSAEFARQFPATPDGQFRAVLAQLDHNVARLRRQLEATGQDKNTIIIFASDNGGPNIARDNNWPLLGKKATYLEGGQRSPLLVKWPGHLQDRDIREVTRIIDIYPTLIELAGGLPPTELDGVSLVSLLKHKLHEPVQTLFYAADSGVGMNYGGRNFKRGTGFYRPLIGNMESFELAGPMPLKAPARQINFVGASVINQAITSWEQQVRKLPLSWQPLDSHAGQLTGRDFQRAPIFGGYTLGLAIRNLEQNAMTSTLIDQPGVWKVELLQSGQLRVSHGQETNLSAPIEGVLACNSLTIGMHIKPESSFPFPGAARSKLLVRWNGKIILSAQQPTLTRPAIAAALRNPTVIGSPASSNKPFPGDIAPPIVYNKFLDESREGLNLQQLDDALCSASSS
jgi:arylsulfatase A-like enzyme